MKILITVLTTICLSACSPFGIRSAEEPRYQVLNDAGPFQIRHYPSLVVALTRGAGLPSGERAFACF